MLNGVAGNPALIQDDGLHPRAEAQAQILENVWPTLEAALQSTPPP
jgi:acyl-CoA thioesterase-1